MQKLKSFFNSESVILIFVLFIVAGVVYLLFVPRFGYFNDDWYLMYAAGAKGPTIFRQIFSIDRPLRALVMIPAYYFFGSTPFYYNLSAFIFRFLSGCVFLWILLMIWPRRRSMALSATLLFLTYPGFLSQPNAIDYQSHIAGLAAGMFSVALTIKAVQSINLKNKIMLYLSSILFGWFYLSQIEWYIGVEFFRFACVFIIVGDQKEMLLKRFSRFLYLSYPLFLIPGVFLSWRIFFFKSERGATNLDLQFSGILSSPFAFLITWVRDLGNDALDVFVFAWLTPLKQLSIKIMGHDWFLGFGAVAIVLIATWIAFRCEQRFDDRQFDGEPGWLQQVVWLSIGLIFFGLLPVILVGRSVDFKEFSRYSLIASIGASLLWSAWLSYLNSMRLRTIFLGLLLTSATLTHYGNGLTHARDTEVVENFWWQVGWRIPQMENGTTLVVNYPVVAEEDYFIWGPANLIYYQESMNDNYVQPSIYAALLNQETVAKIQAGEGKDFSNRRGIRTYKNYRNILVLSQPTPSSCVQIIDGKQIELSSSEDSRLIAVAKYSEIEHIVLNEQFHTPPLIPFDLEPPHGWCYFYEKASYARQLENWEEIFRLGEETHSRGLFAKDQIEWMPFLQAYAHFDNVVRLKEIASFMVSDSKALRQACQTLTTMQPDITPSIFGEIKASFCLQ